MARRPNPPPDDPEQSKRFIDLAREVQAEGTEEDFIKAFRKVASRAPLKKRGHENADAYEPPETKRRP